MIKVAIVGLGNCASSLIQGIHFYKNNPELEDGLAHPVIGGYKVSDIEMVLALDIDKRKVGKDINEAIFSYPNCTKDVYREIPPTEVKVRMGKIIDSIAPHMVDYPENNTFLVSGEEQPTFEEVVNLLIESKADILINYLPVGSEENTRFYAEAALKAKVAFLNCIPSFIVSDPEWGLKFKEAGVPCVGDDIKSQLGATIIHRVLTRLFEERGVKIKNTYKLNVGGNTDFLNMLERKRLKSKKLSKTEAVMSQVDNKHINSFGIHVGPSDYVPWLKDTKVGFIRLEGFLFGEIPMNLELRLEVEDSPNSGGVVVDALRCLKLAKDRGVKGPILSISSYYMKRPPQQYPDGEARELVEKFINNEINY